MVLRKPVGSPPSSDIKRNSSPSHRLNNPYARDTSNNPPYPTSPLATRTLPTHHQQQSQEHNDFFNRVDAHNQGDAESPEEKDWWDESDDEEDTSAIPIPALQPEQTGQRKQAPPPAYQGQSPVTPSSPQPIPSALRVGNSPAAQSLERRTSSSNQAPQIQGYTRFGNAPTLPNLELDQSTVWAETRPSSNPSVIPPPYPAPLGPPLSSAPAIAALSPERTNLGRTVSYNQPPLIPVQSEDVWTGEQPTSSAPAIAALSPPKTRLERTVSSTQPPLIPVQDPWSDETGYRQAQSATTSNVTEAFEAASTTINDPWNTQPHPSINSEPNRPPKLDISPPRISSRKSSTPETPLTRARRQRNEVYQVKHIRWYDMKARHTRISPILTQNDNGPCPLLALVNALVLTTPANQGTALIGTLFNKEQVSLGLLLDAVFDELTSGRRGDTAHELPDIGQLYSFLITLHTGMTVNPRFVEAEDTITSPPRAHPGTFEMTKEMRLYSTFDIPLIHGWIPSPTDSAKGAFERQKVAQTYEDAQNMQFHAEELEAKFHSEGLSDEEQDIFTDVIAIKEFLTTYPTQLSDYGLETMKQWIQPGQVVILFRNDHFSTLYKQPDTGRLLTLVTDAGYATHDEIVWESLADVNGMYSELFSGDFRSVDNTAGRVSTNPEDNSEWTTVKGKNPRHSRNASAPNYTALPESTSNQSQPSTNTITESLAPEASVRNAEQEDHDLALALQLQEEADAEQRAHDSARAEEIAASERFLSRSTYVTQAEERPPAQPPRPNDRPPMQPPRPRRPPPTSGQVDGFDSDSAPPPPYEPVQKSPTYQPPQQPPPPSMAPRPSDSAHRRHSSMQGPAMSPRPSENSQRRQSAMSSTQMPSSPVNPLTGRRRLQSRSSGVGGSPVGGGGSPGPATPTNNGNGNGAQKGKDEKCIVM